MQKQYFYVDTCIWLNIFKKEGDSSKGKPYWEIADEFLNFLKKNGNRPIISPLVLREIKFKLGETFKSKERQLKKIKPKMVVPTHSDYELARKYESFFGYDISFYDCIYVAICKRRGFHLVTRDKELLRKAKSFIKASKPEDILNQSSNEQTPY